MWERPKSYDDPFMTPPALSPTSPPSDRLRWARPRRMSFFRFRHYKIIVVMVLIGVVGICRRLPTTAYELSKPSTSIEIYNSTVIPYTAFKPPESGSYRGPDIQDTFQSYKFRNSCNVSSLDLHTPFSPLCQGFLSGKYTRHGTAG